MTDQERPPALDPDLVNQFVGAGHGNFEKIQALFEQEPQLLHARWDWGGGDWESALEAAAHTGQREIAEFLLSKGARLNIFAAAMLGELDLVKMIAKIQPEALTSLGAHGIPLIRHAMAGRDLAKPVLDYLEAMTTSK